VALVRKPTIPTERPPPVGEVSANFCGIMHCCGVNTSGRFRTPCSGYDIEIIFSQASVNTYEYTSLLIPEFINNYSVIYDYYHLAGFYADYTADMRSEIPSTEHEVLLSYIKALL
jgi:hypothetical protein